MLTFLTVLIYIWMPMHSLLCQSFKNNNWHATKVRSSQFGQWLLLRKFLYILSLKNKANQFWKKEKPNSSSAPNIDLVKETKLLKPTLDAKLFWDQYIDALCKKLCNTKDKIYQQFRSCKIA